VTHRGHAQRVPLHPNDSRRSATPRSGSVKQGCKTRAQKCAAGTRKAVCMESSAVRAGRPHPEERACRKSSANSNARARVSKDEDERLGSPSCFETHRSAFGPWKRLRSRRTQVGFTRLAPLKRPISGKPEIGCDAPQHEGGSEAPTNGCTE